MHRVLGLINSLTPRCGPSAVDKQSHPQALKVVARPHPGQLTSTLQFVPGPQSALPPSGMTKYVPQAIHTRTSNGRPLGNRCALKLTGAPDGSTAAAKPAHLNVAICPWLPFCNAAIVPNHNTFEVCHSRGQRHSEGPLIAISPFHDCRHREVFIVIIGHSAGRPCMGCLSWALNCAFHCPDSPCIGKPGGARHSLCGISQSRLLT